MTVIIFFFPFFWAFKGALGAAEANGRFSERRLLKASILLLLFFHISFSTFIIVHIKVRKATDILAAKIPLSIKKEKKNN